MLRHRLQSEDRIQVGCVLVVLLWAQSRRTVVVAVNYPNDIALATVSSVSEVVVLFHDFQEMFNPDVSARVCSNTRLELCTKNISQSVPLEGSILSLSWGTESQEHVLV